MNIWVNGCFDILHPGHIDLLWYAKLYGGTHNKLYVGIDSDARVKKLKGESRPINDSFDRFKMLINLKMVDECIIFNDEKEIRNCIIALDIDYIIVGIEYLNYVVYGSELSRYGVKYYKKDNHSTTNIINKIKTINNGIQ